MIGLAKIIKMRAVMAIQAINQFNLRIKNKKLKIKIKINF